MSKFYFSDGIRPICYDFRKVDGVTYIFDNQGFIVDKVEVEKVIKELRNSIESVNWGDVENYNTQRDAFLLEQNNLQYPKQEHKKKPLKKGFIYFIKDDKNNVKIGMTKDITKRFYEYTRLSFEPIVLKTIKSNDMISDEKYYHDMFSEKHKRGEWFELSDSEIEFIKGL